MAALLLCNSLQYTRHIPETLFPTNRSELGGAVSRVGRSADVDLRTCSLKALLFVLSEAEGRKAMGSYDCGVPWALSRIMTHNRFVRIFTCIR